MRPVGCELEATAALVYILQDSLNLKLATNQCVQSSNCPYNFNLTAIQISDQR
jgi:hypothetical protein